jgi:hypothetical protein
MKVSLDVVIMSENDAEADKEQDLLSNLSRSGSVGVIREW